MSWNKQAVKFLGVALAVAIVIAVIAVVAKPEFVKHAGNEMVSWITQQLGLSGGPNVFN